MKINIGIPFFKEDVEDNEFTYISPFPTSSKNVLYCHYQDLTKIVDDGELDAISCNRVLNFISHLEINKTINHWCKKLKHGGKLFLFFEDIVELCRLITIGTIEEQDISKHIYGGQEEGWNFKKSGFTIPFIKNILVENDMIIENIKLDSFYCYIESRRK
ncbi:hypothetical protein EBU24_00045 [bacterium]|nr:hypothetical protein [bacterium]